MTKLIITSALTVAFLFVGCGEKDKTADEWKAYYKDRQEEAIVKYAECKKNNIKPKTFEEAANPTQEMMECHAANFASWKRPIKGDEGNSKPWKNL